jgi:hypothetical protein
MNYVTASVVAASADQLFESNVWGPVCLVLHVPRARLRDARLYPCAGCIHANADATLGSWTALRRHIVAEVRDRGATYCLTHEVVVQRPLPVSPAAVLCTTRAAHRHVLLQQAGVPCVRAPPGATMGAVLAPLVRG